MPYRERAVKLAGRLVFSSLVVLSGCEIDPGFRLRCAEIEYQDLEDLAILYIPPENREEMKQFSAKVNYDLPASAGNALALTVDPPILVETVLRKVSRQCPSSS